MGKSTLFNALTQKSVPAENYPFCTIDPSVGIVRVPDERLQKLAELSKSLETIPAVVEFVDIAGLVAGAAEGEGLGNKFLANIRETDAIAQVVRIFEDPEVHHVSGSIDPMRDVGVINLELVLADLETVSKRKAAVLKDAKRGLLARNAQAREKEAKVELSVLEKIEPVLLDSKMASEAILSEEEEKVARHLHLLTRKPMLYVLNVQAGKLTLDEAEQKKIEEFKKFAEESGAKTVVVDAGLEGEFAGLSHSEREEMRKEFGAEGTGIDALIVESYKLLDLISYFTTGEKETRAWTIRRASTAPEAGAAIHSDFEDKFIRAEVIFWEKLLEAGSYASAREKGWVRTEGKQYVIEDGDVVEFRI